ncbi:uroporphyrinogen decarboxylase [Haloterrigena alkaliphila]|uniref:Uroporphyrinogen decarboxylase n=1 Tax=Haloterrigena alkaliphila TaxID=2816475 RepID=A0A8A2VHP5_9EURY|nr:uroporphyrinogen decarboxylase [Haloterrigena alkaliphila]QSX00867.1 uroporphyrinogen decarboxylase [Haloterrigena alkaliphila]
MDHLLTRAARGERTERPPVWLMRQAGRHIPEYRTIREDYTFKEAIKTPSVAERITLLPWELYEPDGLVIYSDILTVLEPLGFDYRIESGVGPVIENPVDGPGDVERETEDVAEALDYVGELIDRLVDRVGDRTAIIGFAGGPFTLASYAVAGGASDGRTPIRRFRAEHPDAFRTLLERFAAGVRESLEYQIRMGADVVQLFDTYASVLTPEDYEEFVLPLHREILADLDVPSIVFVKNMAGKLDLLEASGADVVGLDWSVDMAAARERLGDVPVQGNLDPTHLYGSEAFVEKRTREIVEKAGPEGHILNLGHGVLRDTPVERVRTFVETAKSIDRSR